MKQEQIRRQPSQSQRERRRERREAITPSAGAAPDVAWLAAADHVLAEIDAALASTA